MSDVLEQLRKRIATRLLGVEDCLPDKYRLTLVARHTTEEDSDIIVTADDMPSVLSAINHLYPEHCYLQADRIADLIAEHFLDWDAEAGQREQIEQDPGAYVDSLKNAIVQAVLPVLWNWRNDTSTASPA